MGESDTIGAERMDLLGDFCQERGNQEATCGKSGERTEGGGAEALLLDWLHPPDRQAHQPFREGSAAQTAGKCVRWVTFPTCEN